MYNAIIINFIQFHISGNFFSIVTGILTKGKLSIYLLNRLSKTENR